MNNEAPYMSEEHIVAWLDGELQADAEVRSALSRDRELAVAAREHSAISKSFARSKSDSRFILPAAVDARVYASLKEELSTSRKKIATGNRIADREPIAKPSTADRMKKVWVRRTSYALGLALLLGGVWFGVMNKTETPTQYSTIEQPAAASESINATPESIAPQTTTAMDNISSSQESITRTTAMNTRSSHPSVMKAMATPAEQTTAVVATAAQNVTPQEHDPAAAMISHRFAKLIKETPSVVVSQQDKMDRM